MKLENIMPMLCPPGEGVYTVNTAKERKQKLQTELYPQSSNIEKDWKEKVLAAFNQSQTLLLGICSDSGGGILRGANWGPLFIREQLVDIKDRFLDLGDIRVIPHLLHDKYINDATLKSCRKALYQNSNVDLPVSPLSIVEKVVEEIYKLDPSKQIFSLGGDHSVSYPLTQAYFKHKKQQGIKAALIHFDAHTDLLTERLGIDICFGSWTSHVIPLLEKPNHLIQLGIRSSGKDRGHWEKTFGGIKQYWAQEILSRGAMELTKELIEHLKAEHVQELYISFDIDALDERYASATGTPEPNGLRPQDAVIIIKELGEHFKITGADLVELAPFLKTEGGGEREPLTTLSSADSVARALLGELTHAHL